MNMDFVIELFSYNIPRQCKGSCILYTILYVITLVVIVVIC